MDPLKATHTPTRRLGLILAAALCLTALLPCRADWPNFRGPNHDNTSSERGLAEVWPPEGPRVVWSVAVGEGYSGPSILAGRVYLLDREDNQRDVLRAFDFANGAELWRFGYDAPGKLSHNGSRTTPSVDGKFAFTIGPFGHMHCVDLKARRPVWVRHLLDDFGGKIPTWGVGQSPLLYRNMVIVAPQSPQAGLVALRKETGDVVWKSQPLSGEMSYSSPVVVSLGGMQQVLMVTSRKGGGGVAGLDPDNGRVLWRYSGWSCSIAIPSPVPIGDGRLFLTGGYRAGSAMIRIEKTGADFAVTELFKTNALNNQIHQPILYKGHLYANGNSNETRDGLMCLDLDGTVLWKTESAPSFDRGPLILADGRLFMVDAGQGTLHMVAPSPEGYKELARAKYLEGREMWAPMALTDGRLIIRDHKQMKCLDLKNP